MKETKWKNVNGVKYYWNCYDEKAKSLNLFNLLNIQFYSLFWSVKNERNYIIIVCYSHHYYTQGNKNSNGFNQTKTTVFLCHAWEGNQWSSLTLIIWYLLYYIWCYQWYFFLVKKGWKSFFLSVLIFF